MTHDIDPLIGQEIDGYRIEKLLGKGGMARVYRAQDVRLRRWGAVKVIEPDVRADPEYVRRFEREARAVAQLQHPHIVNIWDYGEVESMPYMVMQYIEGADLGWLLADYARDGKLMPQEDVLRIVSQLAGALDYAHRKGVVHRDIKPGNVMLDKDGRAILTDFGLALVQAEGTRGEIFGTADYIAPEQAVSSAGAVPQSDQYALGVMLYEMLTGGVPFAGKTAMDIAMAHMTEPLPSPLERNPDLHPAFAAVLEKALDKEPENRYPTCVALAADLERAVRAQAQEPTRPARISLLRVSDQVKAFRAAYPLPPLPAPVMAGTPPVAAPRKASPKALRRARRPQGRRRWLWVSVASAIVILLGFVTMIWLVLRNCCAPPPTLILTATAAQVAQAAPPTTMSQPPTPTATFTWTAAPPSVTATVPTPTATTAPTLAVVATAPRATPATFVLQVYRRGQESLVVVNRSLNALPLASLQIGDGNGAIMGTEWNLATLQAGACVAAFQARGNPKLPDVQCDPVGARVTRSGAARFWGQDFAVYYGGKRARTCKKDDTEDGCFVPIVVR